tara:strand:+ start:52 stop:237 length:186 start_codon:yes stop_codon:yes gene_type:complete
MNIEKRLEREREDLESFTSKDNPYYDEYDRCDIGAVSAMGSKIDAYKEVLGIIKSIRRKYA